jgi:glycolate oxidase iron-sulfur subunit
MSPNARGGFEALDPCVHCGFCLPACPTYLATGDENDSPRGRIHLMRAVERGELSAADPGVVEHLEACLGYRGCEPVCPSGVEYGRGLAAARARIAEERGLAWPARFILGLFSRPWAWRSLFALSRGVREAGIGRGLAGRSRPRFLLGMLEATRPFRPGATVAAAPAAGAARPHAPARETVALFRGCVMDGLFGHVHRATRRTLEVNGYRVVEVAGQACCGALHEHAGDRRGAVELLQGNVAALRGQADVVVVNSAGCGAMLKEAQHILGNGSAPFGAPIKDVTELLVAAGPVTGAALSLRVCYDAPCHLQHAQGIHQAPIDLLRSIPGLEVTPLRGSDRCCGAAGIYGVLHPELSRIILEDKIAAITAAAPAPAVVATGNPGCLMQIGAGLRAAGSPIQPVHPVELVDWSYRLAGWY